MSEEKISIEDHQRRQESAPREDSVIRESRGGVALSYSPPQSASPSARKRGHPKWRQEALPPSSDYPLQQAKTKKASKSKYRAPKANPYNDAHYVEPAQKTNKRFNYNHGEGDLPRVKQSAGVRKAQTKIRDHVAFFKNMSRDKGNAKMFDKTPMILYKAHPDQYDYDRQLDSESKQGVALRHRPMPN